MDYLISRQLAVHWGWEVERKDVYRNSIHASVEKGESA